MSDLEVTGGMSFDSHPITMTNDSTDTANLAGDMSAALDGYMKDHKGRLIPEKDVKESIKLKDQMVLKIFDFADELSAQIRRFKGHTYDDIGALMDLLREKYDAAPKDGKGNMTFTSFDGTKRVSIAVSDYIDYGPELEIARELLVDFIKDEAETASDILISIIERAFNMDKPGKVNREALFSLRTIENDDPRWQQAMEAITDSIRMNGSKAYIRIYKRDTPEGKWQQIPLSLAAV